MLRFCVPCLLQIPLYKIGYARSLIFILYKILLKTIVNSTPFCDRHEGRAYILIGETINNEAQSSNQFTIELSKRRMNGSEGGI